MLSAKQITPWAKNTTQGYCHSSGQKGDFAKASSMEWVQEILWNPKDTLKFALPEWEEFPSSNFTWSSWTVY